MGRALSPAAHRSPRARPWRRPRHRPWVAAFDPSVVGLLLGAIPSLPRPVLARLTERLTDRMDDLDGDPDLEPDDDREDDADREPEDGY